MPINKEMVNKLWYFYNVSMQPLKRIESIKWKNKLQNMYSVIIFLYKNKLVNIYKYMYDHTQKKLWKDVEQSVNSEYSGKLN